MPCFAQVSVDFTPDGHGDTVRDGIFVTPVEKKMPFGAFVDVLEGKASTSGVPYCQARVPTHMFG
jgi:hypothetical protein